MANETEEYHQAVLDVATGFLEGFIRDAIKRAKARGLSVTGKTISSIFGQITELDKAGRIDISIGYNLAGKFRDIKALRYKKQAPVEDLEEFVRIVGVDKFKFIPGYQNSNRVPTQDEAIKRIAWGIAMSRLKRPAYGKPWMLNTLFRAKVNRLTTMLIEATGTATIKIFQTQLNQENGNKG
jgi:hypothetical protein